MTSTQARLSADEFALLPDDPEGGQQELVEGEVVMSPPRVPNHGRVADRIHVALRSQLGWDSVEVFENAGFWLKSSPDTVRAPDIAVVTDYDSRLFTKAGYLVGAPQLAIEVVSPSDTAPAVEARVRDFLEAGANRVWIAWPGRRSLTVHRPDGTAVHRSPADTLAAEDIGIPGVDLSLAVADCFPADRS